MAHVGVKRLRAGHGEEDAAEHDEAERAVPPQEARPGSGLSARRITQASRMCITPSARVDDEEHHHDRAEERRHAGGAAALGEEQQDRG